MPDDTEQTRPDETPLAKLIAEATLAERWDVTPRTMRRRRAAGKAPPFLRLGRRIFYRLEDIASHEEVQRVLPGDFS